MEELLLTQGCDLIVQEIQQCAVALCDSGSDGVIVAQCLDAYCEAGVCLGPCDHLCVVRGESVSSAVQKGIVGVCVSIILLQLHIRIVLLEIGLCCGTLGNDEGLACQLIHGADHSAVRGNHTQRNLHVRKGEIYLLRSLRGHSEVGENDIHLAGSHILHAGSGIERGELYIHTEILTDSVGIVNVIALVLALVIHIAEGSLVGENTDLYGAGFLDLIESTEGTGCGCGLLCGVSSCLCCGLCLSSSGCGGCLCSCRCAGAAG